MMVHKFKYGTPFSQGKIYWLRKTVCPCSLIKIKPDASKFCWMKQVNFLEWISRCVNVHADCTFIRWLLYDSIASFCDFNRSLVSNKAFVCSKNFWGLIDILRSMALLLNRTIMTESSKKKSRKPKEEVGPETKKIEWEDERKVSSYQFHQV